MARKTYKLIKETPELRKGALFQEACDDGTQEYVLLDHTAHKGGSAPSGQRYAIFDRPLVENAPQWFVEVFQVEPQFMTATELEQWKAFKKTPKKIDLDSSNAHPDHAAAVAKKKSAWTPARRKAQSAKIKAAWAAKKAVK
ncbi:hypothetical protein AB4Y95_00330 [Arthrobacter sp. M-10]|uniref:hypothetical protein n=1 Tax=Arthrobacter sp. M-10 TaxID=3233037 RepID=UPI003F916AEC